MKPDLVLNLADPGVHRRYLARPELLLEILGAVPDSTRTVFIDEVQKVPALLDECLGLDFLAQAWSRGGLRGRGRS